MTNTMQPGGATGTYDPRHIFLATEEVFARYGWGRSVGYQRIKDPGFPKRIGRRYRLDLLMRWEDEVAGVVVAPAADQPRTGPETDRTGPLTVDGLGPARPGDAPAPPRTRTPRRTSPPTKPASIPPRRNSRRVADVRAPKAGA